MKRCICAIAIFVVVIFLTSIETRAIAEKAEPTLIPMHATAYLDTGRKTYSGVWPHVGIAGSHKDYIGMTAIVYQRLPNGEVGEVIGIYEVEDTGDTEGVNNKRVIDIWCPDMDSCQDLMDRVYEDGCQGKVFVQFVNAEG